MFVSASESGGSSSETNLDATQRTARLLGLIPWVATRGSASIEEIEARFDYPRKLLLADLTSVAHDQDSDDSAPDNIFSHIVTIDWSPADDRIYIRCPKWLSDSMRLNGDEAARLLATGQAALSVGAWDQQKHGDDNKSAIEDIGDHSATSALLRALTKLQLMLIDTKRGLNTRATYANYNIEGHLDVSTSSSINVELGDASELVLKQLQRAVRNRKRIEIEYYAYSNNELSSRVVDPARVFSQEGFWYLIGWCHRVGGVRIFRVDRLRSLNVTDETAEIDVKPEDLQVFNPEVCGRTATLRVDKQAWWVAECCPVLQRRELNDGRLEIDLSVVGLSWFARLLLKLGTYAEVITDDPVLANLRSSTAANILKRYQ